MGRCRQWEVMKRVRPFIVVLLVLVTAGPGITQSAQDAAPGATLAELLERIGQRVQRYTDEVLGIAWSETIIVEELDDKFQPKRNPTEYRYEALVVRRPSPSDPNETRLVASRELKAVDGRPASQDEIKRGKCRDINPSPVYQVPLAFLLPKERSRYSFSFAGEEEVAGKRIRVISVASPPTSQTPTPSAKVENGCFRLTGIPANEGRLWIDETLPEVLKVEWRQPQPVDFSLPAGLNWKGLFSIFRAGRSLRIERNESKIRFERVHFEEPAQTLLVPVESETLLFIRGASSPGLRTVTKYSQFKRFLTDVRVKETQ